MKRLFITLLLPIIFVSCATILGGKTQIVSFQSSPEGATVYISGRAIGKTPISFQLEKQNKPTLTFQLEGHKPVTTVIGTSIEPWFLGNFIIGGVTGSTTDGLSGAIYKYSPNNYFVTLESDGTDVFKTNLSSKTKATEFIVTAYKNILNDIAHGEGEYLSSLINILEINPEEKEGAIHKIKSLSEVYTDIPVFAEHVTGFYLK